ncbi:hypothetical protein IV203_006008 [Nitzschia inconspicua]|uniref:Uncharacterized protein n=1 Tax=Nitzschia inconspicua TaxID=303405 RepID=A0A9K3KNH5_9STRA|nr:hypothetical protein IV203_006008 [Nitzschia inconspicua]
MWEHCYEEWLIRNKTRHGKDDDGKAQRRLEKAHQSIRALYVLTPKCSLQAQRHCFHPTVENHVRIETDVRNHENWLETYEPMIKKQDAKLRKYIWIAASTQLTMSLVR